MQIRQHWTKWNTIIYTAFKLVYSHICNNVHILSRYQIFDVNHRQMFSSFIRLAISQYNARILLCQSVIYCLDINMMGQCTPVPTVRLSRRKHDNEIYMKYTNGWLTSINWPMTSLMVSKQTILVIDLNIYMKVTDSDYLILMNNSQSSSWVSHEWRVALYS